MWTLLMYAPYTQAVFGSLRDTQEAGSAGEHAQLRHLVLVLLPGLVSRFP